MSEVAAKQVAETIDRRRHAHLEFGAEPRIEAPRAMLAPGGAGRQLDDHPLCRLGHHAVE